MSKVKAGDFGMAIFYLDVKPIGGKTGRSAIGAAGYRRAEKMRDERSAVGAAAYHRGDCQNDGDITHDFTHRKGVVHSEIMLPDHAPREYFDSQTLWNAAQKAENRWDARTAREIVIALQNELTPEQNMRVVRKFVGENFVDEGMCADFSYHSGHIHGKKGEVYPFEGLTIRQENPHVHIQLTVRPINPDGSWGAKSKREDILDKNGNRTKTKNGNWRSRKIPLTDWDETKTLERWRENWAKVVNKEFERLGMDERISHLSLKEQGIDREPTVHMGHEAWNLERKGIKTEVGEKNRAIMRRNIEREKAQKPENIADYMHELKQGYVSLDKEISSLSQEKSDIRREILVLENKAEQIDERSEQIKTQSNRLDELKAQRREMGIFSSKKAIDEQINRFENSLERTKSYFKQTYHIAPEQAESEVKRLVNRARNLERVQAELREKIAPLVSEKENYVLEYRRQKLLAEISPNRHEIEEKLKQLSKESRAQMQSPQDEILWAQGERTLNIVTERHFQDVLKKLQPEQARALIERRKREMEREKIKLPERTR
jgi:hypothetical protein